MHGLTAFAGVAIVALLFAVAAAVLRGGRKLKAPGLLPKALLSDNEKSFFWQLEDALPGHRVFPQVAFAAFLTESPGLPPKARHALRNRFDRKIADFVVCDRQTLQIVALVELDDRTHVASRDRKRDELTQAAGYRTVRFQSKQKPSSAEIAAFFTSSDPTTSSASFVDTRKRARY